MSLDDDLHEVQGTPEQLADLWARVDDLDSAGLAAHAVALGLTPPADPPGYPWEVVVTHPNIFTEPDRKVLAWLGPDSTATDEPDVWEETDDDQGDTFADTPPSSTA